MEMGIYCIHDECGRLYYGSTVNFNRRWNEHKSDLRLGKHKNPILQAAYNKYGIDYFTYTIVEIVENRNLLLIREQDWLDWLWKNTTKKTRYNLNKIAEKPPGNKGIFSAETRKKMSDSAKKRVFTPEQRKKQADTQRGKKLTDAVKARMKEVQNRPEVRIRVLARDMTKKKIPVKLYDSLKSVWVSAIGIIDLATLYFPDNPKGHTRNIRRIMKGSLYYHHGLVKDEETAKLYWRICGGYEKYKNLDPVLRAKIIRVYNRFGVSPEQKAA